MHVTVGRAVAAMAMLVAVPVAIAAYGDGSAVGGQRTRAAQMAAEPSAVSTRGGAAVSRFDRGVDRMRAGETSAPVRPMRVAFAGRDGMGAVGFAAEPVAEGPLSGASAPIWIVAGMALIGVMVRRRKLDFERDN